MVIVVAYLRLSKVEEHAPGHGFEAQRRAIADAVRARKWEWTEQYLDRGVSAVARRRPGLDAAVRHVEAVARAASDPPVLVVAKLDRLARNLSDYAQLVDRARRRGWQLLALDAPDATTPAGEAMQAMVAVFAQLERRLIAARTREALAAARARGVRLGRPPAIDRALSRRVMRRYGAGWSAAAVAADLGVNERTVREFLRRRGVQLRRGRPTRTRALR